MGEVATLALGIFIGMIIYWVVYRMFWHRWRKYQEQDLSYLRSKVESEQFTSISLERQIAAQKAELAEQHNKITSLERDKWMAQSRLAEINTEKQLLVTHLDTLRAEMLDYKRAASEAQDDAPMLPPNGNGNGKTHNPLSPTQPLESAIPPILPMTGFVENGQHEAPQVIPAPIRPSHGKAHTHLPTEQILEPVLLIARPCMSGDRLEIIPGIGASIVKKLNRAGIDSFLALSQLTPERLREIVGSRAAKQMDIEQVITQAKKLASDRRSR